MERDASLRLLLALALSTALHLSLIYGFALAPSEFASGQVILARLMPRAQARTAPTAARAAGSTAIAAPERAEGESAATALSQPSPEPIPEPAPSTPGYLDDRRLPDVDIPVLVDPTWYSAKDLDLYPQPLAPVEPAHPASVPDIAGEVTLLLSIDEFGVVQELSVVTAEPAGHFEQPALQAFNGVRFAPAQRDGRPVRSRIVLKVRFAPSMRDSDAR